MIRDRPRLSHLTSTRLVPTHQGISLGIPHSLSHPRSISGKSHKHPLSPTSSSNQSSLSQLVSGSSTSPRQPFGTPATTLSLWGYPPALKMPNSRSPSLPHFPSPRSPSYLSLCGQTPVLSTPRENCPVQSRSSSCSVIFHPNSKLASHPLFSLSAPARPKPAKPITATCQVAYSVFLVSLVDIDQRCIL